MATLNIYGCGGAGINLAKKYIANSAASQHEEGFCDMKAYFIDTSRSNLNDPAFNQENVYLMDGLDGSGKKRDSNYGAIRERSKEIVQKFKPSEINVVIHSASGGSGSVIGPILAGEISEKSLTVIILIGSTDSRIETDNTIKTIMGYEVIAQKKDMPVAVMYYENGADKTRGMIDNEIGVDIALLSILFSGDNAELDSADLKNFINYQNVTTYKPSLTRLEFFSKEIELARDQYVASLATLTDENTDSKSNILVSYQAVGYINRASSAALNNGAGNAKLPIHAAMIVGYFHPHISSLQAKLAEFDEHRATVVQKSIADKAMVEKATDDGLIF